MQSIHLHPGLALMTWQKLIPICLLTNHEMAQTQLIEGAAALSALWGSITGLNQTNLRTLMSFSSITHLSWMLTSTSLNMTTTLTYLAMYSLNTIPIFLAMALSQSSTHKSLLSPSIPQSMQLSIAANLLSLAGLPPLMGFSAKLLIITQLSEHLPLALTLVSGTAISLYFYLVLTLSALTNQTNPTTSNNYHTTSAMLTLLPQTLSLPLTMTSIL